MRPDLSSCLWPMGPNNIIIIPAAGRVMSCRIAEHSHVRGYSGNICTFNSECMRTYRYMSYMSGIVQDCVKLPLWRDMSVRAESVGHPDWADVRIANATSICSRRGLPRRLRASPALDPGSRVPNKLCEF